MNERTISITIPTFNREEMLFESFANVYDDERISEIVVSDDASDIEIFNRVKERCSQLPKIKPHRNLNNQDCYFNKMTAISHATQDWCVLLDDDNIIDKSYLDRIFEIQQWDEKTIYQPDFAYPNFSFKSFSGKTINSGNVGSIIDQPMGETMLNAMNFFVNKNEYLKTWDGSVDPVTSDSIYFCLKWLEAGNKIYVVPELQYFHRVHHGHYTQNISRTQPGFHEWVLNRLRELK